MAYTALNLKTGDDWTEGAIAHIETGIAANDAAAAAAKAAADGKAAKTHAHKASEISDASAVGRGVLTAADAAAARAAIGAGTSSTDTKTAAGTAAQLAAGTDATQRSWTAKDLIEAIDARIAAAAEAPAGEA